MLTLSSILPVLNPYSEGTPGPTRVMADSRSLIYTSGAPHSTLGQTMTLLNFDKFINFEVAIPSAPSSSSSSSMITPRKQSFTFKNAATDIDVQELRAKMADWRNSVWSQAVWTTGGVKWNNGAQGMASWVWWEKTWARRGVGGEYIVARD